MKACRVEAIPAANAKRICLLDGRVENLQAGQQEKRVVKLQDGPFSTATGTIAIRHDQSHGWKYCHRQKQSESTCH